jgi:tetratricopeptide (TPR) repeat protein
MSTLNTSVFFPLLCAAAILLAGCGHAAGSGTDPYYITGTEEQREVLRDLFGLLENETRPGPEQFAVALEIAGEYGKLKEYGRLINFLSARGAQNPDDPYTAYYVLMMAYAYNHQEAWEVAALYFDRIVKNYPDLQVQGESIHYIALNRLINLVSDQNQLVWYYEELLARFPEKIDSGQIYFLLGQAYEQIGEWNAALAAYTQFLPYYGTVIQGFPNAYTYAKQLVDFNNSPKDWTFESLNALVTAINRALQTGNDRLLWTYRAKVNFFDRSWGQEEDLLEGFSDFNLSGFMRGNQIRFSPELDEGSNASEAYLRTWGWSLSITTWYLYFRKINFPPTPEIHGRWEWAGVYYGEKW